MTPILRLSSPGFSMLTFFMNREFTEGHMQWSKSLWHRFSHTWQFWGWYNVFIEGLCPLCTRILLHQKSVWSNFWGLFVVWKQSCSFEWHKKRVKVLREA